MTDRFRRALLALVPVLLFGIALEVLRLELRAVTWRQLVDEVSRVSSKQLLLAAAATVANYGLLTAYDFLAFASIGRTLGPARIGGTALLAYAVSNNVGFAAISGASVRYRFYSRRGVTWEELSRLVVSYSITFWLGLFALGGVALLASSSGSAVGLPAPVYLRVLGALLIGAVVLFLAACVWRREPVAIRGFKMSLPPPRLAFAQLAVSSAEWLLASLVLFVLLPPGAIGFLPFVSAFLIAILLGMASHVPGGAGVFEGLLVLMLKPALSSAELLPALMCYRVIYYLLPLMIAVPVLLADELYVRRTQARRAGRLIGRVADLVTPRLLAAFTFFSGLVLLLSGATPAAPGRLGVLTGIVPLELIELSHFAGSVAGAVLLVVSQALARRLDAAYYVAAVTIVAGIAASLLKGLDFEEAAWLLLLLAALWRARPAFDRRAAFFATKFSPAWVASLLTALGASIWLGLFAFKHVDYSSRLWWQVAEDAEVSRFLRASIGAAMVLLVFGIARLIRHAPHEVDPPSDEDLAAAARIVASSPSTQANLVFLRDKGLIFNEARTAFIMYGVQGRTWVSMGDPVGPPECTTELLREFLERCDDFGATPVFYEIERDGLHYYADFGLTFIKLGEGARVDLRAFTTEGPSGSRFRQSMRRLDKDGGSFRIVPVEETAAIVPELRRISDDWLAQKAAAEKGFSLGFFDEAYVARFPIALIEYQGRPVAFANLWLGANREELSIDLMRYHHEGPKGVMEALLTHILVWAKAEGFAWFALGMAPLSGFETSPVAPLWNRLGAFLYEHGDTVYNFQGLRAYKEKFDPVWEPRYLACRGGLRLPLVLGDVSALIAGGYRRIFLK